MIALPTANFLPSQFITYSLQTIVMPVIVFGLPGIFSQTEEYLLTGGTCAVVVQISHSIKMYDRRDEKIKTFDSG